MRLLVCLSLVCCSLLACSSGNVSVAGNHQVFPIVWDMQLFDSGKAQQFRITISVEKTNLTGILIVKHMDGTWRGSVVNEFGVKAFDFISSPEKCRLLNVMPLLDKRHIKKTIAEDFRFLFEIDHPDYKVGRRPERTIRDNILSVTYKNKKEIRKLPTGELSLENKKRGILYSLKPLK